MKRHFKLRHMEKRPDPKMPGEYVDTYVTDMGTWAESEEAAWKFFNAMLDPATLKKLNCYVVEDTK